MTPWPALLTATGVEEKEDITLLPCHLTAGKWLGQLLLTHTAQAGLPAPLPPGPALLSAAAGEG